MTSPPIRPGTARRLGLRRPGEWSDTMERNTRPRWGSTDFNAGWTETSGTTWRLLQLADASFDRPPAPSAGGV